jgi:hypothetical protein
LVSTGRAPWPRFDALRPGKANPRRQAPIRRSSSSWARARRLAARTERQDQRKPSTARRASSTAQSSSWERCPTSSPRREASTAPSCSTRTRVDSPAISTSGRNDAGRALRDVGATITTERGRNSSACTTTAKRSPCCSCPTPFGRRRRWRLPRSTKCFHQLRYRKHLLTVGLVGLERGDLGRQLVTAPAVADLAEQSGPYGLGPGQTRGFERSQRPLGLVIEPHRDRLRHYSSVSRSVLRRAPNRMP